MRVEITASLPGTLKQSKILPLQKIHLLSEVNSTLQLNICLELQCSVDTLMLGLYNRPDYTFLSGTIVCNAGHPMPTRSE